MFNGSCAAEIISEAALLIFDSISIPSYEVEQVLIGSHCKPFLLHVVSVLP
jgi:hypothetical protein